MTDDAIFFDTNIVVYAVSADQAKASRAEELLSRGGTISVQVLNEAALVLRRKFNASWRNVEAMSIAMKETCEVVPIGIATHELGLKYAERYKFAIYDANIVAAAVLSGCTTLYSEDMHHGLLIDGLTILNPFRTA